MIHSKFVSLAAARTTSAIPDDRWTGSRTKFLPASLWWPPSPWQSSNSSFALYKSIVGTLFVCNFERWGISEGPGEVQGCGSFGDLFPSTGVEGIEVWRTIRDAETAMMWVRSKIVHLLRIHISMSFRTCGHRRLSSHSGSVIRFNFLWRVARYFACGGLTLHQGVPNVLLELITSPEQAKIASPWFQLRILDHGR